jgi:hypothetical protein
MPSASARATRSFLRSDSRSSVAVAAGGVDRARADGGEDFAPVVDFFVDLGEDFGAFSRRAIGARS